MDDWDKEFSCPECQHWHDKFKEARMDLHYNDCNIPLAESLSSQNGVMYKPHIMVDKYNALEIQKQITKIKEYAIEHWVDKEIWDEMEKEL